MASTRPALFRPGRLLAAALLVTLAGCSGTTTVPPPGQRRTPPPARDGAPVAPPTVRTDPEPAPTPASLGVVPPTPAAFGVDLDTVRAGAFDQGRMWTFDFPPVEYLQRTYGIEADSAWLARARLGALRIPSCSASFVSPHGLVMTNHHCARDFVTQVSREGENLLDEGFQAHTRAEERTVEDFEADQLVAIVDVTAEIDRHVGDRRGAERARRIDEKKAEIIERLLEERGGEESGHKVEVISLYNGALHSAYIFRTYTDVRLVMAPELRIGYFGGDPDNFTYPRYNLDFAFFRVYDGDRPLETPDHFPLSTEGVQAGDPVFVVGNPGSTSRLQTVAQLLFRRDVSDRAVLAFLRDRAEVFREYIEGWPAEAEAHDLRNVLFGILNSEKAYTGQLEGLADPVIVARRMDTERRLQGEIAADPALAEKYGTLVDEMAALQERKATVADGFGAFLALTVPEYASPTLHRALLAYQILNLRQQGAPETATAELMELLVAVSDKPRELDELLVEARLRDFIHAYGEDTRWLVSLLAGRTPEGAATVVVETSALADSASAVEAVRTGTLDPNDPAMRFVGAYIPTFIRFQQVVVEASAQEDEIAARLGRVRHALHGTAVPPDATFSLRLADGVVAGFPYNGTRAPAVTTFHGLYDRHYSFAPEYRANPAESPWGLPERWLPAPAGLDLSTPINFSSTVDIIGGNSGSPVLNADLEAVGVVFDGNIESLSGDYIYLPESNRAVTVDSRAILESLRAVWGMPDLVRELTEGALVPAGG